MSSLTLTQSAVTLTVVLIVWQLLRRRSAQASLKNIPGPPSNSFVKGVLSSLPLSPSRIKIADVHVFKDIVNKVGLIICQNFYLTGTSLLKVRAAIEENLVDGPREINILHWMSRSALEMIGQSGLGHSFDSLTNEESENLYIKSVHELLPTTMKLRFFQEFMLSTIIKIGTGKFRSACIDFLPSKHLRKLKEIVTVMDNTSDEIFKEKKRALEKGDEVLRKDISQGKDIISILTQHPEVQEKLRREVKEALEQYGEIPHDELVALPYLDAICRETLRL
ncbi:hypothetical protein H0H81_010203 [Sphagnurus paluster]|uniref:Cytochrome P450 n=1 Tax=Sphagnurus paluster TaxID=117069 RepID=A0A9P7G0Z8_9AGAR|nr:hypothetical protein H0H81_010203 [Sphagnurus paluster]